MIAIILLIIEVLLCTPIFGAEKFNPDDQSAVISLQWGKDQDTDPAVQEKWKNLCDALGQKLLQKPSEIGFLSSYLCGDKLPESHDHPWRIELIADQRYYTFEIFYRQKRIKSFNFLSEDDFLSELEKPETVDVLAHMLVTAVPLGWGLSLERNQQSIIFRTPKVTKPLAAELFVYDMFYDPQQNLWFPRLRARLQEKPGKQAGDSSREQAYEISVSYLPLRPSETYWVQNAEGLQLDENNNQAILSQQLKEAKILSLLERLLLEQLGSNYVGLRFGRFAGTQDALLKKAWSLSLLFELRKGLFEGLRFYYDKVPTVKHKASGVDESFGWKRAAIGWNFRFEAPRFLSDYMGSFDIQPKLGLLDLSYQSAVFGDKVTPFSFSSKNVYDFGLELGIETAALWYHSRLWATIHNARFGIANTDGLAVNSQKIGLDVYFGSFDSMEAFNTQFLIFSSLERLSLKSTKASADSDIDNLSASFALFGGGLVLKW